MGSIGDRRGTCRHGTEGANMIEPREYADKIRASWRNSTQGILDTCKVAHEARSNGALRDVANELVGVMDRATLAKLAIIGETSWPAHAADVLPPHWGTIYELTKLDPAELSNRLVDGSITPRVQRKTISGWRKGWTTIPTSSPLPTAIPPGWDGVERRKNAPALVKAADSLDSVVAFCEGARKAGKPNEYVGKVKPARLTMAIAFLQAVLAAEQQGSSKP